MRSGVLLFVALTLILVVARLPASTMDHTARALSGERLRVLDTTGTFWRGSGMLAVDDRQRGPIAMRRIEWQFAPSWQRGGLTLQLAEHGRPQAGVLVTGGGVSLHQLALDLPLELLAGATTHPAGRAGWRGRLDFGSPGLTCDWRGRCDGALRVHWSDAGLDILPERHLGSHEIRLQARGTDFDIDVRTLDGELRIDGSGRFDLHGQFAFNATVEGDPDIVDRIPNVMDRNARRLDHPGRVAITLP